MITVDDIQLGVVFSHRNYFKIIHAICGDVVFYSFFDRSCYYFPPNNRRQEVTGSHVTPVQCQETVETFLRRVNEQSVTIDEEHYKTLPKIGVVIKNEARRDRSIVKKPRGAKK